MRTYPLLQTRRCSLEITNLANFILKRPLQMTTIHDRSDPEWGARPYLKSVNNTDHQSQYVKKRLLHLIYEKKVLPREIGVLARYGMPLKRVESILNEHNS